MKIAMLSPIAWRTAPRYYDSRESIVSVLTEWLLRRGVDVTHGARCSLDGGGATVARFRMRKQRAAVAVILSAGGAALDLEALRDLPGATVVRAEVAAGDRAVCVSATLEHDCGLAELRAAVRVWAGARGWVVAVAPLAQPG